MIVAVLYTHHEIVARPFTHYYIADWSRTIVFVLSIILMMEMLGGWHARLRHMDRFGRPINVSSRQMITLALGDAVIFGYLYTASLTEINRLGHDVGYWRLPSNIFFLALACLYVWRRDYRRGLQYEST